MTRRPRRTDIFIVVSVLIMMTQATDGGRKAADEVGNGAHTL